MSDLRTELQRTLARKLEGNFNEAEKSAINALIFNRYTPKDEADMRNDLREITGTLDWTVQHWDDPDMEDDT